MSAARASMHVGPWHEVSRGAGWRMRKIFLGKRPRPVPARHACLPARTSAADPVAAKRSTTSNPSRPPWRGEPPATSLRKWLARRIACQRAASRTGQDRVTRTRRPPRFGELVEPRGKTVVAARRYWDRPRKLHIKRAPLAHLAVKPDLAPQQPAQFLDDRKPKPRAGILASQPVLADRRRALTELFEDR